MGGTVIGVIGGEALGDPTTLGLDAAFRAVVALALRAPTLAVVVVAALAAALARLAGIG